MPTTKKAETKEVKAPKKAEKTAGLTVDVMTIDGKTAGTVELPKEIFGAKVNPVLMAQAVRVYLANQRQGTASTKTRGEINASTRKIYRQKGTGRARHGAVSAPIFVGGGITFGPQPRDFRMAFPQKMRRAALFSALSQKHADKSVVVVDGVADIKGKTKEMVGMLKSLNMVTKNGKSNKVLFVVDGADTVKRAGRNVEGLSMLNAKTLSTYEILNHNHIVIMKDALEVMKEVYTKNN